MLVAPEFELEEKEPGSLRSPGSLLKYCNLTR